MTKSIVIGIYLGKKDEDLKRWFKKIKESNLEQSFYIKKAIKAHIDNEVILLGRIYNKGYIQSFNTSYTVPPSDTEIIEFINELERLNIKVSSYIKQILRKYIEPVNTIEDEYIPSYFDIQLELNKLEVQEEKYQINSNNINKIDFTENDKIDNDQIKIKNPLINNYI